MAKSPSVLLLIPAFNEEERIGPVVRNYAEYFRKNYDGEFRAVVVLNGCRDNTLGVVEEVVGVRCNVSRCGSVRVKWRTESVQPPSESSISS